jgi:1-acyl-sn-glycerol-3-phosphate acyltransferase
MINTLIKKLNWFQRLVATAVSFTMFGLGGMALSIFYFPLVLLIIKEPGARKKIIRASISASFRFFINFMSFSGIIKLSKKNIELLQNENSCMLISNHPTLVDVVAIIAYCPNASCVVKESLFHNFFIKGVVKAADYIPNVDPVILLEKCRDSIEKGDVLIIFPEGTRTKPGKDLNFQRGAAHIALNLNCPIRCVHIRTSPSILSKGLPWYSIPERRSSFELEVKDRLYPSKIVDPDTPRPLAARKITREFLNQYCSSV